MNVRQLAAILRKVLPANSSGDACYAWAHFLVNHRRLPGGKYSGRLNDSLFRLKVDGTLLDPMRQFVSDKEYVKHYISAVVGRQFTLETLQVLRNDDDVNRLQLAQFPCVVKAHAHEWSCAVLLRKRRVTGPGIDEELVAHGATIGLPENRITSICLPKFLLKNFSPRTGCQCRMTTRYSVLKGHLPSSRWMLVVLHSIQGISTTPPGSEYR